MTAPARYDVIVVGAGPAGSVCAATLAKAGRRVLLLERSRFPRDKVCGDCLNPSIWAVIDRLDLRRRLLALPHMAVRHLSYHGIGGASLRFDVPSTTNGEIVVKRRDLDALLVARAIELGADFRDNVAVTGATPGWRVDTSGGPFHAARLIAADGRNSTLARLTGRLPASARERVAIQCHCRHPAGPDDSSVRMLFYREGYGGVARVNADEINLCLVASPQNVAAVKAKAMADFAIDEKTAWRTIAPLTRRDATDIARDGLFLVGDAARVIEPFTGEGIYYAMRSGELAAECLRGEAGAETRYRRAHARMYRGRMGLNRLARFAGTHPRLASLVLRAFRGWPAPIGALTARVIAQT